MKLAYETCPCSRCGGSGRYSLNSVDGSRCYGCRGRGVALTKRGLAARQFASTLLDVPVEVFAGMTGRVAVAVEAVPGRRFKVDAAQRTERPVAYRGADMVPINGYGLSFEGQGIPLVYSDGCRVRLVPTEEEAGQIMAFQESLTKQGKPRKRAA